MAYGDLVVKRPPVESWPCSRHPWLVFSTWTELEAHALATHSDSVSEGRSVPMTSGAGFG